MISRDVLAKDKEVLREKRMTTINEGGNGFGFQQS
jgi:hypothetical protein